MAAVSMATNDNAECEAAVIESCDCDLEPGCALIKQQYLDLNHKPKIAEEFLPEEITNELKGQPTENQENDSAKEPAKKRPKLKGRNKKRPIEKNPLAKDKICPQVLAERECSFGERCKFSHDVTQYLADKPPDLGEHCYNYETYGKCQYSIACRFGSRHISSENKNIVNEELYATMKDEKNVLNSLDKDLQKLLWKRKYDFTKADDACKLTKQQNNVNPKNQKGSAGSQSKPGTSSTESNKDSIEKAQISDTNASTDNNPINLSSNKSGVVQQAALSDKQNAACDGDANSSPDNISSDTVTDTAQDKMTMNVSDKPTNLAGTENGMCRTSSDVPPLTHRDTVKKKIDFRDKLYLAPLTTVGNLPFRRICKRLGADVTCGEMSLCTNLLQGQQSEWALLKRHKTEDLFGIQVCGSFPDTMTKCAQMACEKLDVDFIDINCGCPIDLIFKRGEGSALMGRTTRFEHIVKSMTSVMDVPLTVKIRTGIYEAKSLAHTLLPRLRDWGVSMVTVHGRSREQRYTRLADWDYIDQCTQAASPMPVFGNGDILSYEDYLECREHTGVSGAMIARGAIIKPWIFTEIKENRHWDISATERLDMLKDFVNFGYEHWGTDQQGITTTRRFLLEWLSFLYRYIPVGLLERLPQRINEKPPYYFGRSDLETTMASPNCADWVKISEMVLGPVPPGFVFLPKHKANSYQ